jgi:mevalonate kinase
VTRARCGHKVVVAGSYVVLDGHPGIALAVDPGVEVEVQGPKSEVRGRRTGRDDGPVARDPLTAAVLEVLGIQAGDAARLEIDSTADADIAGWGLGSSAAYAVALTAAACGHAGLAADPGSVFPLARAAHRAWQDGVGSGLDVAACCFGGAVVLRDAASEATPIVSCHPWPARASLVLARSGAKADTRALVAAWRSLPPDRGRAERSRMVGAVDRLVACLATGGDFLATLAELAAREAEWSRATGVPLVTPLQEALASTLGGLAPPGRLVVKALGAGGGDSIGVFLDPAAVPAGVVVERIQSMGIEARTVEPYASSMSVLAKSDPVQSSG